MDLNFVDTDTIEFDPQTYIRILIAIAKADKDNGPPEYAYVRKQAQNFGLNYDYYLETTDKTFSIHKQKISRLTALVILKDAIMLASLDRNFSLPERQKIYGYAENLDIPRKDVDVLELLINEYYQVYDRWQQLVAAG